ncbi:MAG: SpoIIE family protein phosphatase [Desulfobacterales bacterium]
METLPPVTLGVILLISFLIVLAFRVPAERRFVNKAPGARQPRSAFILDLTVCLAAGLIAAAYNRITFEFTLSSAGSLMIGCAVAGFFIGLDSALIRERILIRKAISQNHRLSPPKHLFSITRKFSFVALVTTVVVSTVMSMVFARDIVWLSKLEQDVGAILDAQMSVAAEVFFIMAVLAVLVINLIIAFSHNLKLLFNTQTDVLERISHGDLSHNVPVATKDEFGVIAGHTNKMIDGLRHRLRLLNGLTLAEEVQQNLLPQQAPRVPGLDISGTSIYCDKVGGDYYDYFRLPDNRWGIVVADASGHGVGAAMHMTTVRAFLHFAARQYQGPAQLLTDVNTYATRDSSQTSRFMSVFFLEVNPADKTLLWVRAGHEPALFFDSHAMKFSELNGRGMALGIDEEYRYQSFSQTGWNAGDIILIGTDGIHETHDEADNMYGQHRLREIVRKHAGQSSASIKNAIIESLQDYRKQASQEDDITLVVIKLL